MSLFFRLIISVRLSYRTFIKVFKGTKRLRAGDSVVLNYKVEIET